MMNTATTIEQLGGRKFLAMTGAKNFVFDSAANSLRFQLPRSFATNGATHVRVTLEPSDTYRVEFMAVRGIRVRNIKAIDMVYGDSLRQVFESETGLRTSL